MEGVQPKLSDPELAAAYLNAALQEDSTEKFLLALRSVADAHGGLGTVAEAAQLNRQTLYRTLSSNGNPTLVGHAAQSSARNGVESRLYSGNFLVKPHPLFDA